MASPLQSLIASGTKLWLDSIDPDLVLRNRALGATGATSNPIIISDLIKTGRFDAELTKLMRQGLSDHDVAWQVTDTLVRQAQKVFEPVWQEHQGGRRLRQLRARSAPGRSGPQHAGGGTNETVHRAGQEVGGRAHQPHDQDPGHAGRAGRGRRTLSRPESRST